MAVMVAGSIGGTTNVNRSREYRMVSFHDAWRRMVMQWLVENWEMLLGDGDLLTDREMNYGAHRKCHILHAVNMRERDLFFLIYILQHYAR